MAGPLLAGPRRENDGTIFVAEDVFLVTGITTADDPLADPQVPALGTPHPTHPGAKVDSHRLLDWIDGTAARVAVFYSSDRRGRLYPRVRDDEISFVSYAFSSVSVTVDVPYFERRIVLHADNPLVGPPVIVERMQWEPAPKTVESADTTFELTYNVNVFTNVSAGVIASQINHIHTFPDGSRWQFKGGDSVHIGPAIYQLKLQWFQPGVLPAWPPAPDPGPFPDFVGPPALPQFFQYRVIPSPDFDIPPQIVADTLVGIDDPNGWRTLPGGPPL